MNAPRVYLYDIRYYVSKYLNTCSVNGFLQVIKMIDGYNGSDLLKLRYFSGGVGKNERKEQGKKEGTKRPREVAGNFNLPGVYRV